MRDRVADVLAQRAALDRGAAGGVAVSLLLHGSVTALAIYAAMHQPPRVEVSTLNIRFAQAKPVAPPAPPKPETPRIEPPKPEPLKPVETAKAPEKNTVPMSPFGKSTKKGSENPPVPKPTPQPAVPATTTAPEVAVGQTGVTGLEGDFPHTIYLERMKTAIGAHWYRPTIATDAKATVYFVIERDGRIRDAKVETVSGNGTFDRAALRAVLESSPLPPLPFAYNGTYLGVHLTFR